MFMMFCLLWTVQPITSFADSGSSGDAAESLTIRYCYSDGEFTEAAVFTEGDFSGVQEESYSFMDSMPSPCMDAVTGVLLSDLLSDAGIEINDVDELAFYATDVAGRPYRTYSKSELFSHRYYYPHIMEYWNTDTQSFTAEDSVSDVTYKAVEDAVRVYPMICISDNWVRGAMEPDFGDQDDSTRYRLVIGQPSDPTEITARDAVKWIYRIDVTLEGSAPSVSSTGSSSASKSVTGVSLDKTSSIIAVGSTLQLTASVTPQDASDKTVAWSSSDTAVATVSDTGLVTAVTPGTVTITATTSDGEFTAACAVTVNPAEVITPVVTTPPVTTPAAAFNDISGHWAESGINKLVSQGAVGGYPDGSFKPDNTITRAEFATMLVKAFGLTTQSKAVFADTYGHWANDYISSAASSGIISGYENNIFRPDDLITREQMAVMIFKAAKLAQTAGTNKFTDSGSISAWAAEAVAGVTENGIMKGYQDNTFKPRGNATRAEAVTTVANALKQ
jgi:hypothetical protein